MKPRTIGLIAVGIAAATASVVLWLWWAGTAGLSDDKLVAARFDALRTGLSIGLGGGGLFALYLAWRRQHSTEIGLQQKEQDQAHVARAYDLQKQTAADTKAHQERVAAATETDAVARRITDLYTKAIEQLGSDKAPVRLGGLYALERLAEDNVAQRQIIVNVWCAYLRMPFDLPGALPNKDADDHVVAVYRERVQEREVRLTAQRLLADHLRHNKSPLRAMFWADVDLDLTGAVLIDFSLQSCTVRRAIFRSATFVGRASFQAMHTTLFANFTSTTFTDPAYFHGAQFDGGAYFGSASFAKSAGFKGTRFTDDAKFGLVSFAGPTEFSAAVFAGDTDFTWVDFASKVDFESVSFHEDTDFSGAKFADGLPSEVMHFWPSRPAD